MGMTTLNEFDVAKMEREVSKSHPNEKSQPKVKLPEVKKPSSNTRDSCTHNPFIEGVCDCVEVGKMDEEKMIQNIIKRSDHLIPSRRVDFNTLQKQINLTQEGVEIADVIYMEHVIEFNKNYYVVKHPELKESHWIVESGWNTGGNTRLIFTKVRHVMDKDRFMSDEIDVSEHYEFTYNVILSQKIAQAITAIIMFPDLKRALG